MIVLCFHGNSYLSRQPGPLSEACAAQTDRDLSEKALPWLKDLEAGLALVENRTEDAKQHLETSHAAFAEPKTEGDEEIATIKILSERRWAALTNNSGT